MSLLRAAVSGSRHRLREDGYDLDLAYIRPNVVACGFPSSGLEAMYRDSVKSLARFLNARHPDSYLVVNLSQRAYDHAPFGDRVVDLGFEDKHSAPLELVVTLARTIDAFLAADPAHVVVVHCLAGKGRTGVVVASYLLWSGWFFTAAGRAAGEAAIARMATRKVKRHSTAFQVGDAQAAAEAGAEMAAPAAAAAAAAPSADGDAIDDEEDDGDDEETDGGMDYEPATPSAAAAEAAVPAEATALDAAAPPPAPPPPPPSWRRLADMAISHFIMTRGEGLGYPSQRRTVGYIARLVADAAAAAAAAAGAGSGGYDREAHVIDVQWPALMPSRDGGAAGAAGGSGRMLTLRVRPAPQEPQQLPAEATARHPASCPCSDCAGSPQLGAVTSESAAASASSPSPVEADAPDNEAASAGSGSGGGQMQMVMEEPLPASVAFVTPETVATAPHSAVSDSSGSIGEDDNAGGDAAARAAIAAADGYGGDEPMCALAVDPDDDVSGGNGDSHMVVEAAAAMPAPLLQDAPVAAAPEPRPESGAPDAKAAVTSSAVPPAASEDVDASPAAAASAAAPAAASSSAAPTPSTPLPGEAAVAGYDAAEVALLASLSALLRDVILPKPPTIHIWQLLLLGVPAVEGFTAPGGSGSGGGGCRPVLQVSQLPHQRVATRVLYDSSFALPPDTLPRAYTRSTDFLVPLSVSAPLGGDVLVRVAHAPGDTELLRFSFHTGFVAEGLKGGGGGGGRAAFSGGGASATAASLSTETPSSSTADAATAAHSTGGSIVLTAAELDFNHARVGLPRLPPDFAVQLFYDVKATSSLKAAALAAVAVSSPPPPAAAPIGDVPTGAAAAAATTDPPTPSSSAAASAATTAAAVDDDDSPSSVDERAVLQSQFFTGGYSL